MKVKVAWDVPLQCGIKVASVNITVMKDVKFPSEQVPHTVSLPAHLYTCAPSAMATLSTAWEVIGEKTVVSVRKRHLWSK